MLKQSYISFLNLIVQSVKKILVHPKYKINFSCTMKFLIFQRCYRNLNYFHHSPYVVLALNLFTPFFVSVLYTRPRSRLCIVSIGITLPIGATTIVIAFHAPFYCINIIFADCISLSKTFVYHISTYV